jgi:archaellum component FlaC
MSFAKSASSALLAAAFLAAPAVAQTTAEELKRAVDKLEQATKDLQAAKDALKVDALRDKVGTIDSKIDLIDKDIQDLKKDIREIKRKLDGGSVSLRPDFDSTTTRGQARVRFINEFFEEMSVVVNGLSYRLLPGQERLISVPAGEFTYQVLQLQRAPQVRRIVADETKNIRIYPLP